MKQKKIIRAAAIFIGIVLFTFTLALFTRQEVSGWRKSIMEKRRQKDVSFKTSPTSPMAAVKRLLVKAEQRTFVIEKNRDVSLSVKELPGVIFSLIKQKGKWVWQNPAAGAGGITCNAAGKPLAPGSSLPGRTVFRSSCCVLVAYPTKDGLVLMVYDLMRKELKNFSHLIYFPPDSTFAVPAVLKKFPTITPVTMLTSRNLKKTFYRYASIHFKLGGKNLQLAAFKFNLEGGEGSNILFLPFNDTTNGTETYSAGRFLEVTEPQGSNLVLDFNRCYNPLCNYSPAYNCPLPPLENNLVAPIKAGEKTYPHASGGQGGSFRENHPPGPPAKAIDKVNKKFFGGPGGDFSKKPPGRRRQ